MRPKSVVSTGKFICQSANEGNKEEALEGNSRNPDWWFMPPDFHRLSRWIISPLLLIRNLFFVVVNQMLTGLMTHIVLWLNQCFCWLKYILTFDCWSPDLIRKSPFLTISDEKITSCLLKSTKIVGKISQICSSPQLPLGTLSAFPSHGLEALQALRQELQNWTTWCLLQLQ